MELCASDDHFVQLHSNTKQQVFTDTVRNKINPQQQKKNSVLELNV